MARAVIKNKKPINTVRIEQDRKIITSAIYPEIRSVKIKETIPFRVRFTNIQVPGYGPNNPAPIGIAIIGYSNYIL